MNTMGVTTGYQSKLANGTWKDFAGGGGGEKSSKQKNTVTCNLREMALSWDEGRQR